ncbi:MAG: hypothetical protein QOE70_3105 [Chthoniobacter sp.]|jgi:azurin|nr:hypothetical protein [Chthoniobacter sp.]
MHALPAPSPALVRLFLAAALGATAAFAAEPETFTIKTLPAQMRYDVTELMITPGAQVKIIFENQDQMPHNMCFFQPGTDVVAVSNQMMEKPEEALKRNWLPEDPRMWMHSKMVNPEEKEELVFKAPDKPGEYPYVCTFPGHATSMQGRLKVFAPGPQLTDLKFQLYLGDWKKLPDFSTLQPQREGEIADGLIQLKFDDYKNQFAVVYTGKLNAPKEAEYTFAIASDDGTRLLIDDKKVVEHDGIHPSTEIREGKVKLKAGEHVFRLEYFQAAGGAEVFASWKGADFSPTPLSKWVHPQWKSGAKAKKKVEHVGMPLVVAKEPIVYRNFIAGAGNRGIAVGYPGGMSIAWNAEQMNLVLLWRGAFFDAARHWTDRGGGAQPPLGYDLLRPAPEPAPPFARLAAADTEWPKLDKSQRAEGYQWKGYQLDALRFPTFLYTWEGVQVADRFDVEGDAVAGSGQLIRTLKLTGQIPPEAFFRVAAGSSIQPSDSGFAIEGGKFGIDGREYQNSFEVAVEGARIAGQNLVVPARPEIKITYTWPGAHAGHARKP